MTHHIPYTVCRKSLFPGKNFVHQLQLIFEVIGSPLPSQVSRCRFSSPLLFPLLSFSSQLLSPLHSSFPVIILLYSCHLSSLILPHLFLFPHLPLTPLLPPLLPPPPLLQVAHITNQQAKKFLETQGGRQKMSLRSVFNDASDSALALLDQFLLFDPEDRITGTT